MVTCFTPGCRVPGQRWGVHGRPAVLVALQPQQALSPQGLLQL